MKKIIALSILSTTLFSLPCHAFDWVLLNEDKENQKAAYIDAVSLNNTANSKADTQKVWGKISDGKADMSVHSLYEVDCSQHRVRILEIRAHNFKETQHIGTFKESYEWQAFQKNTPPELVCKQH